MSPRTSALDNARESDPVEHDPRTLDDISIMIRARDLQQARQDDDEYEGWFTIQAAYDALARYSISFHGSLVPERGGKAIMHDRETGCGNMQAHSSLPVPVVLARALFAEQVRHHDDLGVLLCKRCFRDGPEGALR